MQDGERDKDRKRGKNQYGSRTGLVAPGAAARSVSSRAHRIVQRTVLRWPRRSTTARGNTLTLNSTGADGIIIYYRLYHCTGLRPFVHFLSFCNHSVGKTRQGLVSFLIHRACKGLLSLESQFTVPAVGTSLMKLTMIFHKHWFTVHICLFY